MSRQLSNDQPFHSTRSWVDLERNAENQIVAVCSCGERFAPEPGAQQVSQFRSNPEVAMQVAEHLRAVGQDDLAESWTVS